MKARRFVIWTTIGAAITLLSAAFLSLTTYYMLQLPSVQQRVLRFAESSLDELLVGEFSVDRVEADLFRRIDLYGIRATGEQYGDSVYIEHLTVRYSLLPLLRKRIIVRSVDVYGLSAYAVFMEDEFILPVLPILQHQNDQSTEDGHGLWDTQIGTVTVHSFNAAYRMAPMYATLQGATAQAEFHQLDSFSITLKVPKAAYESPWWNGSLENITGSGIVTWEYLELDRFSVSGSGSHIEGAGRVAYFPDGNWDLSAEYATTLDPLPIIYRSVPELEARGRFDGTVSLRGTLDEPRIDLTMRGGTVHYQGHQIDSLSLKGHYGAQNLLKVESGVYSPLGQMHFTSSLHIDSLMSNPSFGKYSMRAQMNDLDMIRIKTMLGIERNLPGETGSVTISAGGANIENIPHSMELSASITGGVVTLNPLQLHGIINNSDWEIAGSIGGNTLSGKGVVADPDNQAVSGMLYADLREPYLISGYLTGENVLGSLTSAIALSGNLFNPDLEIELISDSLSWGNSSARNMNATAKISNGAVFIDSARVSGLADLRHISPYFAIEGAAGTVEFDAQFAGELLKPTLFASIEGRDLQHQQLSVDTTSGALTLTGDTLRWHDFTITSNNSSIISNGEVTITTDLAGFVSSRIEIFDGSEWVESGRLALVGRIREDSVQANYSVTDFDIASAGDWVEFENQFSGKMSSSGFLEGSLGNPYAVFGINLSELMVDGKRLGGVEGRFVIADSLLSGEARLSEKRFSAMNVSFLCSLALSPARNWSLDKSRTSKVNVGGESLELSWLGNILGDDIDAEGPLRFDMDMNNSAGDWDLAGSLHLHSGKVTFNPEEIEIAQIEVEADLVGSVEQPRINFSVKTGQLSTPQGKIMRSVVMGHSVYDTLQIDSIRFEFQDEGIVSANCRIPYNVIDSILTKKGLSGEYVVENFPIVMLSPFLPDYALTQGVISSRGSVDVLGGRPLVTGSLSVEGARLDLPDISPRIESINVEALLRENQIQVQSLAARWGNGRLRGSGTTDWDLDGLRRLNLNVRADNLEFELPEVVQVGIESADIRITDRASGYLISGKAVMGQTRYIRDIRVTELIQQIQVSGRIEREPDPLLQSMQLRMDVDLANNFKVDMNIGRIDLDGRITVGGNVAEPGIAGEIKAIDGYLLYLDRRFRVTEGGLFNADALVLNPNLNLKAQTDVLAYSLEKASTLYTIHMSVTGTLEEPIVRFSSEPFLNELDIVSVLTLGQTFGSVGSDIGDRLRVFATQQLTGFGARRLEQLLGLDRIDITGDILGGEDAGARVSITKRLSNRLMVTYETPFENIVEGKMTAHYRLTPNIYLEGQATTHGDNGIDLIFRFSR